MGAERQHFTSFVAVSVEAQSLIKELCGGLDAEKTMSSASPQHIWFAEPLNEDDSWAHDRESTLSWVQRSTLLKAREVRRFLNHNIECLPQEVRSSFAQALSHRWTSSLFELVVARVLQEWGAQLQIEVPNQEGRCPDIFAQFPDGQIVVEATSPLYNQAMGAELADKNPFVRIVEDLVPDGYLVGVWELPRLSQSHPRHEFKRIVQQLFAPFHHLPADQVEAEGIELEAETELGEIRLRLFPQSALKSGGESHKGRSLFGPVVSGANDSESRIVKAVRAKRSQVRSSISPAVLALHGGNLGTDLEDFDRALIGHSWERHEFAGFRSHVTERGFHLDGELYRRPANDKPPTYAGVLALLDVGIFGIKSWAFYPHPRFQGTLPQPLQQLPARFFDASTQEVEHRPGESPARIVQQLRFVGADH